MNGVGGRKGAHEVTASKRGSGPISSRQIKLVSWFPTGAWHCFSATLAGNEHFHSFLVALGVVREVRAD